MPHVKRVVRSKLDPDVARARRGRVPARTRRRVAQSTNRGTLDRWAAGQRRRAEAQRARKARKAR